MDIKQKNGLQPFFLQLIYLTTLSVWSPCSVDDGMINEYVAVGGMKTWGGGGGGLIKRTRHIAALEQHVSHMT
jgi:hypothetical protein